HKNINSTDNESLENYLDQFIDFHLKLADAREQRLHHSIEFINELAEYRLLLAAPYLTDTVKEAQLVHEAKHNFNNEVCNEHLLIKSKNIHSVDTLVVYHKANEIRNRITDLFTFNNFMHDLPKNDLTFEYSSGSDC